MSNLIDNTHRGSHDAVSMSANMGPKKKGPLDYLKIEVTLEIDQGDSSDITYQKLCYSKPQIYV